MSFIHRTHFQYPMVCCLLYLFSYCLGCIGEPGAVFLREHHPRDYSDFDMHYGLDFHVGDCFEILKPACLIDEGGFTLQLEHLIDVESIAGREKYLGIKRVVPKGEHVEIAALKMSPYHHVLLVYLRMEKGEDWVAAHYFECTRGPRGHYNQEYYRKLSGIGKNNDSAGK